MSMKPATRLDASESAFFLRQLESIDATTYRFILGELKGRMMLPPVAGVHPDAKVYTYRMFQPSLPDSGAVHMASGADDLPRADIQGDEVSQTIKDFGGAFGYDLAEIRTAAMVGMNLDGERAIACRRMLEEKLDGLIAYGDSSLGLTGMLKIASGTTAYTPANKQRTGTAAWGSLAAPKASGEEIANDIMGICNNLHETTKEAFQKFTVILPTAQYNVAATTRMRDASDVSALNYAKGQCEHIAEVVSWNKLTAANSGSALSQDRMVAYAKDPRVMGLLLPRDYEQAAPQQRNYAFIVNAMLRCGGIVCRYPVAVSYADGI